MNIESFWSAECDVLLTTLPFFYVQHIEEQLSSIHQVFYGLTGTNTVQLPLDTRVQVVADYIDHAHRNIRRSGRPYAEHPRRLAAQYATLYPGHLDGVCALLAHDVIEDCQEGVDYDAAILDALLGGTSRTYVQWLTDDAIGNRRERTAQNVHKLLQAPQEVQNMKVLDSCDNIVSMALIKPKFFSTYYKEKRLFLDQTICDPALKPYIDICLTVAFSIDALHHENQKEHGYAFSF